MRIIHKSLSCAAIASSAVLLMCGAASAVIVHDDHFDDGALNTNNTGVGGGYTKNASSGGNGFTVNESGSLAIINENSGAAQGIATISDFDLSQGVIATWVVGSVELNNGGNRRTFYALQGSNNDWLFNGGSTHPAIAVELDIVADTARLRLHAPNTSNTVKELQDIDNIIIDDPDGFTLTAVYQQSGYTITTSGLNTVGAADLDQVNISGTWDAVGGFSFASLFQTEDLHASAYIQNTGQGAQSGTLEIDRITLNAIPEPSTYIVFGGLFLCVGLAGWWRNRRGQAT